MSLSTAAKTNTSLTHHTSPFLLHLTSSMSRQAVLISKQPGRPDRPARSIGSPTTTCSKTLGEYVNGDKTQEFNKRNAYNNNNSSSPYSNGLTDFSLDISRERNAPKNTSFWSSSWFSTRKHERGNSSSSFSSSHEGTTAAAATKVEAKKKRKDVTTMALQKPSRERDSKPLPMLPLSPINEPLPRPSPYPLPQITQPTPPSESQDAPTSQYEREFIWAEKHRPLRLRDFICNRKAAVELQTVVRNFHDKGEDCGHFIFEGKPGVGKRSMIWALLREAFGPDKVQATEECREFHLKGEAVGSIRVNLMVSPRHTEVNFSELKGYAKHVILELINEKNQNLSHSNPKDCRAIILYEADKLSTDALLYVKWMLEKFKGCNKVLFCCSDASKLESVKPLCRFFQLAEPTNEEILKVLASIAHQEGIELPQQLANKITENSRNNLRQAIRSFEAIWKFNNDSSSLNGAQLIRTGWEDTIAKIARSSVKEQSPKQLYNIRQELHILIEHNVAPGFILQALKDELNMILPQNLLPQFDKLYNDCKKIHDIRRYLASKHQLEVSGKQINDPRKNAIEFMNIEEFMARFMSWYKASVRKEF